MTGKSGAGRNKQCELTGVMPGKKPGAMPDGLTDAVSGVIPDGLPSPDGGRIVNEVRQRLFKMQDKAYADFHSRLIPEIARDRIIGVRTPELRRYAAEFSKNADSAAFLAILPHRYYEENNLHAFLIERIGDFEKTVAALDRFLPYVDNWATCDMMSPKALAKNKPALKAKAFEWISSDRTFTVRYGIKIMMDHFLGGDFDSSMPDTLAALRSEEYYVRMAIAWYFQTALAKRYDEILPYLEKKRLDPWVHNKTIQKCTESRRMTAEQKAYLRKLKIKTTGKAGGLLCGYKPLLLAGAESPPKLPTIANLPHSRKCGVIR